MWLSGCFIVFYMMCVFAGTNIMPNNYYYLNDKWYYLKHM